MKINFFKRFCILILFTIMINNISYPFNLYKNKIDFPKVEPVNEKLLHQMLKENRCYKLLHFWGSWCRGQSIGIDLIFKFSKKHFKNLEVILVATDLYSSSSRKALTILYKKNQINNPIFIFNTQKEIFDEEEIDSFAVSKPQRIRNFISQIDSTAIDISLPYTALFDTSGTLIKSLHPLELGKKFNIQINNIQFRKFKKLYLKELKNFLKKEVLNTTFR